MSAKRGGKAGERRGIVGGSLREAIDKAMGAKCERCGDTGLVTLKGVPNGIGFEMDADDQPCPECQK